MTKQECAVVMAYTGVTMLIGDDFDVFHQYVEHIMNRPVWTHELADAEITVKIKNLSEPDFIELCRTAM